MTGQIWKEGYIKKKQLSTTQRNSKVFLQFSAKPKERGFKDTVVFLIPRDKKSLCKIKLWLNHENMKKRL